METNSDNQQQNFIIFKVTVKVKVGKKVVKAVKVKQQRNFLIPK